MVLAHVRGLKLPIFVFLTFSCLSVFQLQAFAAEDCKVVVAGDSFIAIKAENEAKRTYVRGQNFPMVGMTYNVKNLFGGEEGFLKGIGARPVSSGSKKDDRDKPENELRAIRQILNENNPDWLAVQEVENEASGDMLMDTPTLKGKYHFFLTQGNDPRGINVGIFIKKSLPFKYRYVSNKELKWTDRWQQDGKNREETIALFSRDFPILLVYSEDATAETPPIMAIGIIHSKSKRDRKDDNGKIIDFESNRWRRAQYEGIRKIMDEYKVRYGKDFPFIIAGDFNSEVQHSPDIEPIRPITRSAFDIEEGEKDDPENRGTHAYFPKGGRPEFDQIDDVRVSGKGVRVVEAQVLDYVDAAGKKTEWPSSYKEREKQGSDHKAIRVDLILKED